MENDRTDLSHGQKIAGAIIDHIQAGDVRYPRKALALRESYERLVKAIDAALLDRTPNGGVM